MGFFVAPHRAQHLIAVAGAEFGGSATGWFEGFCEQLARARAALGERLFFQRMGRRARPTPILARCFGATTLREALGVFAKSAPYNCDAVHVRAHRQRRELRLSLGVHPQARAGGGLLDAYLACEALFIASDARTLGGLEITPRLVRLPAFSRQSARSLAEALHVETVAQGEGAEIAFELGVLDARVVSPAQARVDELERALREAMRAEAARRWELRLWAHFDAAERVPTVDATARRLGMSARSFYRELASLGLSFGASADRYREERARRALGREGVTLRQVAAEAGFTELSPFYRAARRWWSLTPGTLRTRLRDASVQGGATKIGSNGQ